MTTTREPAAAANRGDAGDTFHDAKIAYLSETDLFQDLAQRDLDDIERTTAMSTCTRGRVFFTPGETGGCCSSSVGAREPLPHDARGQEARDRHIEPGSVFGEMSLIGQGMSDSFGEAAEDCTLCVMSRSDVERLLREHPQVSVRLLELLARRLLETQERLADVAYKSVPARIASTLLRLSGQEGHPVRLSHQDIAEMVGTYRETATRILNELRADDLIDLKRMQIVVLDREGLDAVAEELT